MTKILLFSIFFSMFEKSWKYAKELFTCFVDFEKVNDRLSNFGGFCKKMALMVSCYMPLSHFMVPTGIFWVSRRQEIKGFHIGIEL